jgi:RND family efflux transporter MFP subunit
MKNWIIAILIVAGGAFAFRQWQSGKPVSEAERLNQRQTTALVEPRDINFAVSVAGEISPAEQVSVRPEVNGKIATLPVDIGDKVAKGEILLTLDDRNIQIEIEQRNTEIASAKLQLDQAKRNFERDQRLFEENLISKEEFENSKTTYDLALNSIQRTEKALELAKDNLLKTKIRAPFDCTVLTRPVSAGQAVSGSGGFNSGTEVLTIADLEAMIINAHVNQADVTRLKSGMKVEVQIEAVPGLKVQGVVERIAPQATIKNNIKGFAVRILLKEIDPRVQPGMTANISIPVASADNVLALPLAAVFTEIDPESGRSERFAYVKRKDLFEKRPIRIGISDYSHAEVLAGVEVGDTVAIEQPDPDLVLNAVAADSKVGQGSPST